MLELITILFYLLILSMPFYLTCCLIAYFGIRYQYKNEWSSIKPGVSDLIMVFTPLLNFGYAFYMLLNWSLNYLEKADNIVENSSINKKIVEKSIGNKFFRL